MYMYMYMYIDVVFHLHFCLALQCDLIDNSENEEDNSAHIISKEIMDEYSKKFGFIDWFLTSAKENIILPMPILVTVFFTQISLLDCTHCRHFSRTNTTFILNMLS